MAICNLSVTVETPINRAFWGTVTDTTDKPLIFKCLAIRIFY